MEYVDSGRILYFWNKSFNLLTDINPQTLFNIKNQLRRIIQDIDNHPGDASFVSRYLGKKYFRNCLVFFLTNFIVVDVVITPESMVGDTEILAEQPIVGEQPVVSGYRCVIC